MKIRNIFWLTAFVVSAVAYADNDNNQLGQEVYNKACTTCHNPSTAVLMKAPPAHDQKAWGERYKEAEAAIKGNSQFKTPLDYLINEVRNGKNAMVPGGMCTNNSTSDKKCTDDEYRAAIKFMMSPQK